MNLTSRLTLATCLAALALAGSTASAYGSNSRACDPVVNPYAGSRYEGIDLTGVKANNVSCRKARRVAKKAHRKALGLAPSPDGFLEFRWRRWDVTGDLRPDSDRYVARRDGKRVRWRF